MVLVSFGTYAQISGTVYRDFNGDGIRQSSFPTEPGLAGITVKAYVGANASPLATTTDTLGAYSFNLPDGQDVRLEFSGFPFGSYESSPGVDNGTSVQFVRTPYAGANLGLLDPISYCKSVVPDIVTTCYAGGDPLAPGGNVASLSSLVQFPYSSSGQGAEPDQLAEAGATGSVWGAAYRRQDQSLFSGAVLRRHSGLGSLGLGGIYRTDPTGASAATTPFLDLAKYLAVSSSADSSAIATRNLPAPFDSTSSDSAAFVLAGKVGLGGMALTPDENKLYAINLYEKTLVRIGLPSTGGYPGSGYQLSSVALPDPGCVLGQARPWALEYYEGSLYVGMTCDASDAGGTRDNLRALVYRFDLETETFINTPVLSEPLNYRKGWVQAKVPQREYWEPWTDDWNDLAISLLTIDEGIKVYRVSHPQPILSDIAFDADGSIILGLMDRTGLQTGRHQLSVQAADTNLYSGYTGGDILRAQKYSDGTYQLEKNGASGPYVGCGVDNTQGPGGGEFYCEDLYRDVFTNEVVQEETFMGSLLVVPGNREVVASVADPLTVWTGGATWFSNLDGRRSKAYEIYNGDNPGKKGYLGRANGLGSVLALCEAAPILIGNRLWVDQNKNGVQDPGEPPLAGVSVSLYDSTGLVSLVTTDQNGRYVFGGTTVKPHTNYTVVYGLGGGTPQYDKNTGILTVGNRYFQALPENASASVSQALGLNQAVMGSRMMNPDLDDYPLTQLRTGAPGQSRMLANAAFVDCWVDAGPDTSVCAGTSTVQLPAATPGQSWITPAGNPSPAAITTGGLVEGLNKPGVYSFILSQDLNCRDTVTVTVNPAPSVTAVTAQVSCEDQASKQNGSITLVGFAAGQTFNVRMGSSDFMFGTAQPIPTNGIIADNLANPTGASQNYLVRVYNDAGCTQDLTVAIAQRDCLCGGVKVLCTPVSLRRIKLQ